MTSGTASKAIISDIMSGEVLFPTESLANAHDDDEKNNNNSVEAEEEEEFIDEESINENEEKPVNPSHEINIQQIYTQHPNRNEDNIQKEQQNSNAPKEEDVNTVSEQFLSGTKVKTNDPTLLAYVVSNLEEKRDQLMMDGDFRNSVATQKAVDAARSKQMEAVKKKAAKEELKNIKEKQKVLESKYKQFEEQVKQEEEYLENEINQQIDAMNERHRKQLKEHDESWQNETKLRQYNRASQRLRVLRTQQQLLMNAKRFDEAEHVCKIADDVAQQESRESYKQLLTAYKKSRRALEEKQEDEMDTLFRACEQKREVFQHQKEVRTQPFIKRINNLKREQEIAKDPERLWILKYRNDEQKMKSYNGNANNNQTSQLQTQDQDQSQNQPQSRTQNQSKNLGRTNYQYQEKKKTTPDYNKLDLPPLFGSTDPFNPPKKGKTKKKVNQKANDPNQNDTESNQKSNAPTQKDNASNQKNNTSTENTNPPPPKSNSTTQKSNTNRPRKASNGSAE